MSLEESDDLRPGVGIPGMSIVGDEDGDALVVCSAACADIPAEVSCREYGREGSKSSELSKTLLLGEYCCWSVDEGMAHGNSLVGSSVAELFTSYSKLNPASPLLFRSRLTRGALDADPFPASYAICDCEE